jgi:dCMP deaminase
MQTTDRNAEVKKFRVERVVESELRASFEQIKSGAHIRSDDPKTQVAAALLDPATGYVLAAQANVFLYGSQRKLLPNLSPDKHAYMRHAERMLIGLCAKTGTRMAGGIVIVSHSPCYECARSLWDAGVEQVIFETEHKMTRESFEGRLDLAYETAPLGYSTFWKPWMTMEDVGRYTLMKMRPKTKPEVEALLGGRS